MYPPAPKLIRVLSIVNNFLLQAIVMGIVKAGPPINRSKKYTIPLPLNSLIFINLSLGRKTTSFRVFSFLVFYLKLPRLPLLPSQSGAYYV